MKASEFRSQRRKAIRIVNQVVATSHRINKRYDDDAPTGADALKKMMQKIRSFRRKDCSA